MEARQMSVALETGIRCGRCLQVPGLEALGSFGALKQITVDIAAPAHTRRERRSVCVPLRHTALPSFADKDAAPRYSSLGPPNWTTQTMSHPASALLIPTQNPLYQLLYGPLPSLNRNTEESIRPLPSMTPVRPSQSRPVTRPEV